MIFRNSFQGRSRLTRNRRNQKSLLSSWSSPRVEPLEERLPLTVSFGVSGTALTAFINNSTITDVDGAQEVLRVWSGTSGSSLHIAFGSGQVTQVAGATSLAVVISGTNPVNAGLGVLVDLNPDNPPTPDFGPLNLPVTITGGSENDTFIVSPWQAATVTGGAGNDSLTVDFTNVGASSATISFDGGAAGNDKMAISGGVDVVYTPSATTNGSGDVTAGGRTISFSNLEPVDFDLAGAGSFALHLPNGNDTVTVANGTTSIGGLPALSITGTSGGVAFESAHVRNATTLTIDTVTGGSNGTDSVSVNSANNAHGNASIAISTGDSSDFVRVMETTLTGDVSVEMGVGSANIQVRDLRIGGDLKLTTGDGFKFVDIAGVDMDGDVTADLGDSSNRFEIDNGTTISPSVISGDIKIVGGDGGENFNIDRTRVDGSVDFEAGDGDNILYFEYDTHIGGGITMTAGTGNDRVTLDDNATFGGDGDFQLGDGVNEFDFNETVEGGNLSITGGSGTDRVDISDTELSGDLTVDLGGGANNFYVERQGGSGGTRIGGNLNATLGSANDNIRFNTSLGGLTIVGNADIKAGDGANNWDLDQAFSVDGNLSITSGSSDDLLNLLGTQIEGDLAIDLGSAVTKDETNLSGLQIGGNTSITTSNGGDKATVNNTSMTGGLKIDLGSGTNTVELEADVAAGATTVGGNLEITTGSGNDTIRFNTSGNGLDIDGDATIDAGDGTNTFDVDQVFTVGNNLSIISGTSDDLIELKELEVGGDMTMDLGSGANSLNAITSEVGGNLDITSIDDLTMTGSGITLSSGNALISVTGAGKLLTSSMGLTATLGSVSITADDMSLSGAVSAATTASLHVANSPRPINIGTDLAGTLGLTDPELDSISAPVLNIGNATAGASNVTADITRAAATAFHVGSSVSTTVAASVTLNTNGGSVSPVSSLLVVNGTVEGDVIVPTGSTLNGSGVIHGNVSGAGNFSPGNSPGLMTVNGNFAPTGTTSFEVNTPGTTAGTHFDQYVVNGGVTLSGPLTLTGTLAAPALGQEIVLIKNDGVDAVNGTFAGLPGGSVVSFNSLGARILYAGGDGNDVSLVILNPTATIAGPATVLVGFPFNFTFSSDQLDLNPGANVTYEIDWNGDNTVDQTLLGIQSGVTVPHTFPTTGAFNVGVKATSANGLFNATASKSVNVVTGAMQVGNDLLIAGTPLADNVTVQPTGVPGQLRVTINGVTSGPFTPTGTINVELFDGNDYFAMQQVNLPGNVNGGGGNDTLIGGGSADNLRGGTGNDQIQGLLGNDNLKGEDGNDTLVGGGGNDILLGGLGDDRLADTLGRNLLIGGKGSDQSQGNESILIGGETVHDASDAALLALLAEWSRSASLSARVSALKLGGGLNGVNKLNKDVEVLDDGVIDTHIGGANAEWFFVFTKDLVMNRDSGDQVN